MRLHDAREDVQRTQKEIEANAARGDERHTALDDRVAAIEANIDFLFKHLKLKKVK